jgi:hypothetical protein
MACSTSGSGWPFTLLRTGEDDRAESQSSLDNFGQGGKGPLDRALADPKFSLDLRPRVPRGAKSGNPRGVHNHARSSETSPFSRGRSFRVILSARSQRTEGYQVSLESIKQQVVEEISRLNQVLQLLGGGGKASGRKVSAAGKARMAAAQRARWATVKGQAKPKRKLSAAGRAAIAAAQKARWAKIRAAKKK